MMQIRLNDIRKAGGVSHWLVDTHEDRNDVTPEQFDNFIKTGMTTVNLAKAINVPRTSMPGILSLYYEDKARNK